MPQDSLRSAVYRSFVTCDDPKGVVECRTFRKSKTSSKKSEGKVERSRSHKEGEEMASKNVTEEDSGNPSSFQLMEVSRGAQKLNQVIDSWSKGPNFDGHSKEIAKDLLKGALDLQESLVMLGKLQEASQYMAKLKRKQKEKSRGEGIDQMGIERMTSHRFTDHNYQMGFQKPRLSADGSSRDCQEASQYMDKLKKKENEKSRGERIDQMGVKRTNSHCFVDHNYQMGFQKPRPSADGSSSDCFEELRTAIRDGLAKQNLLMPGCNEKKACCDKRTLDLALDMASTSSSQSSTVNFHTFASSDSSQSSKAPQKSKVSNLIAKLMGLEEIPSQAVQTIPRKQLESEKISSQRRPMFEIDMPKARKPQSAAYKVDAERRKLKEIVETMQFKGLLKSNSAEGFGLQSHHSNASNSKKRFTEDAPPPIVIIKPLRFSSLDGEEPRMQKFIRDVGGLNTHEVLRNLIKNELQAQTMGHGEGALNSGEMCRRFKGEEAPTKRLSREGPENCKEVQAKPEETVAKTNGKLSSNKLKVSVPVNQEQKRKAIDKKVDRIQKVTLCRRQPAEMENVKSKAVSQSRDQAKVTSTKERKPEIGSNTTKARFSQQKSTSSSPISKHPTTDISHGYGDRKKNLKNEKPVKKALAAANLVVENVGCKYDDKQIESIERTCANESDMTKTGTIADRLLTEEGTGASETLIKDQCYSSQNFPFNVTPLTIQHESCLKLAEEANNCIGHNATENKHFRTRTNAEGLLLSSPSFLSYAEELFDIKGNRTLDGLIPGSCLNDSGKADTRLLLDCANELMQHKSIRRMQTMHPLLLNPARNSKITVYLAQLAEELNNGIENLRSYSKHVGKKLPTDNLYAVLERDLRGEGVASGAWDLGWRHAFTVDEVEQIVGDIEKLVFRGLVEEMFKDFVL